MESQPSILGTVCQLSYTNAALFEELAVLEDGRNHLDRRFESDLSALNKTISELGPVMDVLLLEKPPVSRLYQSIQRYPLRGFATNTNPFSKLAT
jgi:hypothetical protein